MIRLLFIVPVSNAKLERMFSKLNVRKAVSVAPCQTFGKYIEEGSSQGTFDPMSAKKKWNIDRVRCAVEERGQHSYKSRYSDEVNVKPFSDDDS